MYRSIRYCFILCFIASCVSHGNDEIFRLGNFKNRPRGFQSVYMPGGQIALYIRNSEKVKSRILNIRYFIGAKGDYKKAFRVKLYAIDTITGKPGKELLKQPIFVSAKEKNGWVMVNLTGYGLDLPDKGIFAGMEWIPDENFNEVSVSECQYLGYNIVENENNTWYCALGINWYQLPKTDFNTMISIDIKKIRPLQIAN